MTPGFVQTTIPTRQDLHLDRKDINVQNLGQRYILHVPLDVEGMQLRLGKFDDKHQLKHGLIHVTFGSGILLHFTQLHVGHYGSPGNFRLNYILSEGQWEGTCVMLFQTYLEKITEEQDVNKQTQFENDVKESDALGMKTTKDEKLHRTT